MSEKNIYYHNPNCTKSRNGLALINNLTIPIQIKEYLNSPLSSDEITDLLRCLDVSATEIIRTQDAKKLDIELEGKEEDELIKLIIKHPKILQRPICRISEKAVIGRPTETLETFLASI